MERKLSSSSLSQLTYAPYQQRSHNFFDLRNHPPPCNYSHPTSYSYSQVLPLSPSDSPYSIDNQDESSQKLVRRFVVNKRRDALFPFRFSVVEWFSWVLDWHLFPTFPGCPFEPSNSCCSGRRRKMRSFCYIFKNWWKGFLFQVNSGKPVYRQRFQKVVKSNPKGGPRNADYSAPRIPSEGNISVCDYSVWEWKNIALFFWLCSCISKIFNVQSSVLGMLTLEDIWWKNFCTCCPISQLADS